MRQYSSTICNVAIALVVIAASVVCDTGSIRGSENEQAVNLKDGRTLHGQATEEGDHIVLKMALGTVNIPKSNVLSIDKGPSATINPTTKLTSQSTVLAAPVATTQPAALQVSNSEIVARRNQLIADIDAKIDPLQQMLNQLPENRRGGSAIATKIAALQESRKQVLETPDDVIAAPILAEHRQVQQAQEARMRIEQARQWAAAAENDLQQAKSHHVDATNLGTFLQRITSPVLREEATKLAADPGNAELAPGLKDYIRP